MPAAKTLDVPTRRAWRAWLRRNHKRQREVWLVYHAKATGRPSIPYNDAVDEALCFGWIDSQVRSLGQGSRAQRFTPRRKGSPVSPMNQARVRRLVAQRRMTPAGLAALPDAAAVLKPPRLTLAPDVRRALRRNPATWRNFRAFPEAYRRIRVGWVEGARGRPEVFRTRLRHLVRMTRANRQYGMVRG